jgi:hypothetical protein
MGDRTGRARQHTSFGTFFFGWYNICDELTRWIRNDGCVASGLHGSRAEINTCFPCSSPLDGCLDWLFIDGKLRQATTYPLIELVFAIVLISIASMELLGVCPCCCPSPGQATCAHGAHVSIISGSQLHGVVEYPQENLKDCNTYNNKTLYRTMHISRFSRLASKSNDYSNKCILAHPATQGDFDNRRPCASAPDARQIQHITQPQCLSIGH